MAYASIEYSDQPVHPHSLIGVFTWHPVCSQGYKAFSGGHQRLIRSRGSAGWRKKHCIIGYSMTAEWIFCSDCTNGRAYLNLRWVHISNGSFGIWLLNGINQVLMNPDVTCLLKQCRSRSVGFWRSQLIWICTVCHYICEFVSTTWIN